MKKIILVLFLVFLYGCASTTETTTNTTTTSTNVVTTQSTRIPFDSSYSGKYNLKEFYKDNELISIEYEYNYIEIDEVGLFLIKNKLNDVVTSLRGICFIEGNSIKFVFTVEGIDVTNAYNIGENNTLIFESNVGNYQVKLVYEKE